MNIEEELINHYGCEDKKDLQAYLGDFVSIEMIKSFGVLCYNQALEEAAEKVELREVCRENNFKYKEINTIGNDMGDVYAISEDSILNLKLDE